MRSKRQHSFITGNLADGRRMRLDRSCLAQRRDDRIENETVWPADNDPVDQPGYVKRRFSRNCLRHRTSKRAIRTAETGARSIPRDLLLAAAASKCRAQWRKKTKHCPANRGSSSQMISRGQSMSIIHPKIISSGDHAIYFSTHVNPNKSFSVRVCSQQTLTLFQDR